MMGGEAGEVDSSASTSDDHESCPTCGRRMDDEFTAMDEAHLLVHLRGEMLRDAARKFRDGTITHQEQTIVARLVLANLPRVQVPKDGDLGDVDAHMPPQNTTTLPLAGRETEFNEDFYRETEGG